MLDRFAPLARQGAAHTPVVQRQFQTGRLTREQLIVNLQRLLIAPGHCEQACLLQAPGCLRLLQLDQTLGLVLLDATGRLLANARHELGDLVLIMLAQGQAQRSEQHLGVARLKKAQATQRIANQIIAVQSLAHADLLQQPLALLAAVSRLRGNLAAKPCQQHDANQSVHDVLQAGNKRPSLSKRYRASSQPWPNNANIWL